MSLKSFWRKATNVVKAVTNPVGYVVEKVVDKVVDDDNPYKNGIMALTTLGTAPTSPLISTIEGVDYLAENKILYSEEERLKKKGVDFEPFEGCEECCLNGDYVKHDDGSITYSYCEYGQYKIVGLKCSSVGKNAEVLDIIGIVSKGTGISEELQYWKDEVWAGYNHRTYFLETLQPNRDFPYYDMVIPYVILLFNIKNGYVVVDKNVEEVKRVNFFYFLDSLSKSGHKFLKFSDNNNIYVDFVYHDLLKGSSLMGYDTIEEAKKNPFSPTYRYVHSVNGVKQQWNSYSYKLDVDGRIVVDNTAPNKAGFEDMLNLGFLK